MFFGHASAALWNSVSCLPQKSAEINNLVLERAKSSLRSHCSQMRQDWRKAMHHNALPFWQRAGTVVKLIVRVLVSSDSKSRRLIKMQEFARLSGTLQPASPEGR
jgi:hypothetical protein